MPAPEPRSAEEWAVFCYKQRHTRPRLGPSTGFLCPDCARAFAVQECATLQAALTEAQQERKDALALLSSDPDTLHVECVCQIERLVKEKAALQQRVEALEAQEIWVIEEGVEGEGLYTLAICYTESDALKLKALIEQERGHLCPDLVPEVYHLPDEYKAALRGVPSHVCSGGVYCPVCQEHGRGTG